MAEQISAIVTRLEKRRAKVRGWASSDSHRIVVEQVRHAHAALGAMADILRTMAPALTRLLIDEVQKEQRSIEVRKERKAFHKAEAKRLRAEAEAEADPEQAELQQTLARTHEREAEFDVPDMSEVWVAGVLLTVTKIVRSADQVSRSRDVEAAKTLGLKTLATAGKWALKLTPIRQEDLQDLKDVWDALQTLKEPFDDVADTIEAGKLRKGQVAAATSLFNRLDVLTELIRAWNQTAIKEPFLVRALLDEWQTDAAAESELTKRLQRAREEWE